MYYVHFDTADRQARITFHIRSLEPPDVARVWPRCGAS